MKKKVSASETAIEMNDMLFLGKEFVVADIETTALSPEKGGMIIELAGVKIRDNKIIDTFSELIDPERKIYPKTTSLTGITNEMVQGKQVYGQVLPKFFKFLGNAIFVAHNSSFDWNRYLMHFFPKVGIYPSNKVIDTLALSRLYFPDKSKYTLDEMCKEFEIDLENHHRALDDAMATAELLIALKENHATELMNKHYAMAGEQGDLFNLCFDNEIEQINVELEIEAPPIQPIEEQKKEYAIKRVKYWEKPVTKQKMMRRLYVMIPDGTAYFDIHTKTWYNKDLKVTTDFDALKDSVLKYLNLNTIEDLCDYRN